MPCPLLYLIAAREERKPPLNHVCTCTSYYKTRAINICMDTTIVSLVRQLLAEAKKPGTSTRVVEPFNEFLKTLKKPAAQDIVHHLKRYC